MFAKIGNLSDILDSEITVLNSVSVFYNMKQLTFAVIDLQLLFKLTNEE